MLRHAVLTEAREGFRHNQFFLVFQPRVSVASKTIVGFEALLRWRHPRNGLLTPAHFMDDIEMSPISAQLTRFLLTEAIQRVAEWRARGLGDLMLSINMPGAEIMREGFTSQVEHMLKWHKVDPSCLEIEITERTDFAIFPTLDSHVQRLQQQGVRVALDDFGTGFASLGVFRKLPFDTVKLDRSFISGAPDDPVACAVVESFVLLCERLGRVAVIEGVERDMQFDWLRTLPNVQAQGYLLSAPVAAEEIDALMSAFNGVELPS